MEDWEKRVRANITSEAKAFVRKGIPLPQRDPKWNVFRNLVIAEEKQTFERERTVALEERLKSKGVDVDEWLTWAKSLYPICKNADDSLTVKSEARDWEVDMSWGPFYSNIECLERIEELIGYKIADRNRGHGDVEKDLES